MLLTREFIEKQGFVYDETIQDYGQLIDVFIIRKEDCLYELLWNQTNKMITLTRHSMYDDDFKLLVGDKVETILKFCILLIEHEDITDRSITLPIDFVQSFMSSDYDYTLNEFDDMCDITLMMLLAKQEYETCYEFLDFRKRYYEKKGWEYKDMPAEGFKDYSSITK